MRVVCPACEAVYEVPDALLGAEPRVLRCARCGVEWTPRAEAAPGVGPAPAVPSATERAAERAASRDAQAPSGAVAAEPRPLVARMPLSRVPVAPPTPVDPLLTVFPPLVERPQRAVRHAAALGWAATALLLALVLAAAYVWRAEVQAAWPPIQRAYAAIGLR